MRLTNKHLKKLILEELLKSDELSSEMKQFSGSNPGKKVMKAGEKIKSAGASINQLAYEQTGKIRETLSHVAEFAYKFGEALSSMNDLEEGVSITEALPTVAELKRLHKEIARLEKL